MPYVSFIRGSSCEMECPSCGWGFATTYYDPLLDDPTTYEITLVPGNKPRFVAIKAVSKVSNLNHLASKREIEKPSSILIGGQACDIIHCKTILDGADIAYIITPPFPH